MQPHLEIWTCLISYLNSPNVVEYSLLKIDLAS